ncbi:MAG: protein-glutamine gamma-glutamyltransferase [Clostridiales bacterium]|nr:protein-glutamine gamma-glutamyltransferase [Clostridiales bacterium]
MIVIAGSEADMTALERSYPPGSTEARVLRKMAQSEARYSYASAEQLRFELLLRKQTVTVAEMLNRSGLGFEVFHKSKCNEEYWNRVPNGGFLLKAGVLASGAINDIFTNGRKYATECATAMVIVYFKALLNVFGTSLFNRLFRSIYLMNWHSLDPLLREIGVPKPVTDILPGDRAYIKNPDVDPKTPELQGENVIVLSDNLYYGHGVGITTSERIIRFLNQNRFRGATRSAYMLDSVSRPNYKKLEEIYKSRTQEEIQERASGAQARSGGTFPATI